MKLKTLGAIAATAAMLLIPTTADAASLGQLCRVNQNTLITATNGSWVETVGSATFVRIDDWYGPDKYIAHTNGGSHGWLYRAHVDQASCY